MSPVACAPEGRDTYAVCVQAALDLGAGIVYRMVAQAESSLRKRAAATLDEDERRSHVEACELLARQQVAFGAAFVDALRNEFATPAEADSPRPAALSFDSLELMAEDQVDETVELVRAQQVVLSAVQSELAQLNAFVSAAQGDKTVRASANPLRPEAWVRALRAATLQCAVPAAARLRWMHSLSEALGPELAAVYPQLCELLREQGVAAASFVVNTTSTHSCVSANPAQETAPDASLLHPVLNLRGLRRLLIGEERAPRESRAEASPTVDAEAETIDLSLTVPWSIEALQEMKQVDQVMQRMRQRRASDGRAVMGASAGGPSPITPAQALAEEVVKLMVENIIADPRLLPKVQQAVRDLEPALLRLVQNDPRFFNDKQHPTRRLLAEMTQRSLAWSSADAPGFAAFFDPLRQVVEALAVLPIDNAEPFEFALCSLEQSWREQEEHDRRHRATAARVLIKAEKRNLLARVIADDVRLRPDMATAPGEVRRFITGPWTQVMAAARLVGTGGDVDPGGYAAIINDLIWTTQPRLAGENPARLARLVPPLRDTLRRGLESIDYPADATGQWMDYLNDQHQRALRPIDAAAPARDGSAAEQGDENARPEVWLERKEASSTGLMERMADTGGSREVETPGPASAERHLISADAPAGRPAAGLRPGMWADVLVHGVWSRWQLAWTSPHSLLFMMTDGAGRYQSMTQSMLDEMVELGSLRVVSQKSVLDGALDAVAERALRNSMENAT